MEESTTDIIGIFAAVALMFLVPLVLLADRNDDISQLIANSATSSFVENIIKTGTITSEDYANYINQLNSSGNTYDVSIEIKVLDPNYAQEYTNRRNELGSNQYYSIYTTQIEEKLSNNGGNESNKKIVLKDGDVISVIAKNNNLTLSQSLNNIYYTISGEELHIVAATGSGIIAINGAT